MTVSVKVAAGVTVNVADSQPETEIDGIDVILNIGSTRSNLSPDCIGTFSANTNETPVGAAVKALSIVRTLNCIAGVTAAAVAVETVIEVVKGTSVASASVTPTFRDTRLAVCAVGLVVTPEATVTEHLECAFSRAAAVSLSVADAVAEFVPEEVNVVVPQPLTVGVASVPNTKFGNKSDM